MPCRQVSTFNGTPGSGQSGGGGYATEADCLNACKEGACCNGTTCSVKPQCQCNAAAGEVFKGVGTTCTPNPCDPCFGLCPSGTNTPSSLLFTVSNWQSDFAFRDYNINGIYVVPRSETSLQACFEYFLADRPANQCISRSSVWPEFIASHDLIIQISPQLCVVAMKGCQLGATGCQCFQFRADLPARVSSAYCGGNFLQSGVGNAIHPFSGGTIGTFNWSIAPAANPLP